jgi:serine/threonine protein kinase
MNVAKVAKNDLAKTQIGTPYYLAPEIWRNETYSYKCDIFSTGCVLYEMTCLRVPFEGSSMQDLFKKVSTGIIMKIPDEYSSDLYTIIKLCLTTNQKSRPSVEELLEHPIIKARTLALGIDLKSENEKLNKLMGTIKMDKRFNKVKIDLPNQKKYSRPQSVENIQKELESPPKKLIVREDLNKKSVAELMEIIRVEKNQGKLRESSKDIPSDVKSRSAVEDDKNGVVDKNKGQPKPVYKLPPVKQGVKPNVPMSSKQISISHDPGIEKLILESRRNDAESKKSRPQSPQVKKYNDYLEMLIEQNKQYMSKPDKKEPGPRSGSADPKKKHARYAEYNENKPFWWG